MKLDSTYRMMNAAPPCSPTMYGNRQMFPRPTALPAIAMITAKRLPKCSRGFITAGWR